MPAPGDKPHACRVAEHEHSEAVVLDLVDPVRPGRRALVAEGRQGSMKPEEAGEARDNIQS